MRFSTLVVPAIVSALAAAAETVSVSDLVVRNIDNSIQAASFTVQPANVSCSVADEAAVSSVVVCGESAYRFYIEEASLSNYNLTIYKELGAAFGIYREEPLELYCRAGGSSASDYVCSQTSEKVFTLTGDGQ